MLYVASSEGVHFVRLYVSFVKISTACIQLLKYMQVQMLLSDLINIFYCSDLVNQLCLDILPPRFGVYSNTKLFPFISETSTGHVACYISSCSRTGYCHFHFSVTCAVIKGKKGIENKQLS